MKQKRADSGSFVPYVDMGGIKPLSMPSMLDFFTPMARSCHVLEYEGPARHALCCHLLLIGLDGNIVRVWVAWCLSLRQGGVHIEGVHKISQ